MYLYCEDMLAVQLLQGPGSDPSSGSQVGLGLEGRDWGGFLTLIGWSRSLNNGRPRRVCTGSAAAPSAGAVSRNRTAPSGWERVKERSEVRGQGPRPRSHSERSVTLVNRQ